MSEPSKDHDPTPVIAVSTALVLTGVVMDAIPPTPLAMYTLMPLALLLVAAWAALAFSAARELLRRLRGRLRRRLRGRRGSPD